MGFSKKNQLANNGGGLEPEGKKWVIAGIAIRAPLKSITTKPKGCEDVDGDDDDEGGPTTPTAKESRIPERLPCPPAPRKRRPSSTCYSNGVVIDFFTPPDLESVFVRHVETAN